MRRAFAILFLWCGCNTGGLPLHAGDCAQAETIADCQAIAGCMALTCPGCGDGPAFAGCVADGDSHGGPFCDPCSTTPACGDVTSASACDARADCHSLFSGDLPCDSSACSNHFERCEDGATTSCDASSPGNAFCTMLVPMCAQGDSLAVFANGCPRGCVHADRCAP